MGVFLQKRGKLENDKNMKLSGQGWYVFGLQTLSTEFFFTLPPFVETHVVPKHADVVFFFFPI